MTTVLLLLLQVTAVLAAALLGVRLASGARAAVRHLILASAFGVVLILPLATLVSPPIFMEIPTLPPRAADPVVAAPVAPPPVEVEPQRPVPSPAMGMTAPPAGSISSGMRLFLVWAVVSMAFLVPVGASLLHLQSIRRRGRPWPEGTARVNDLLKAAGMRQPLVLLHDGIAGPITSGILHPVIILPCSAVNWSQGHVTNALVHELEHVRRRDWPVHLVSRTVCALYWFHPLAWIAWRALRLEAERACDDAVLAQEDAATYAEQLLELARNLAHKSAPGLPMASGSDLSTRIRSVLDNMRQRGRVGKVMITGIVLAAVVALATLAPLRVSEDPEIRMYRAADLLAKRTDADSLAAAGLLNSHKHPEQALRLIAQASLMAPDRADLVWLHIQLCEAVASCDPEPLEILLRILDEQNGAGWFGALARASESGDEAARSAALAAIARAGRVDIYWTTLIARLSPPVASTKELSLFEAETGVVGALAAAAIPALGDVSRACTGERLMREDVLEVCRGVAQSLLNGDTVIIESIGASIAKRAWPEDSPEWVAADEARRTWDNGSGFGGSTEKWMRANAREFLDLFEQHRREQDVQHAVLVAIGRNPNPSAPNRNDPRQIHAP